MCAPELELTACETGDSRAPISALQLLLLAVAMAAGGYARTALNPLQEMMQTALSLTDNQVALLQGPAMGIPVTLSAIPLGLLIDRNSRARLLTIVVSLSLFGTLLTAFASNFCLLILARAMTGLTGAGVLPVVFSLVSDLYPPTQRGRVTTVVLVGQVAGNSAAFALGGELLALAGPAANGWRWAMSGLSVPLALITLLMFALKEPARKGRRVAEPSIHEVLRELKEYSRAIGPVVSGILLLEMAIGALLIWGAPTLSRNYGLAPERVGTIMGLGMLASGIAGPLLGGALADLCQKAGGPPLTIATLSGLAGLCAPLALFAWAPNTSLASIMMFVSTTFIIASAVMGMTLFSLIIPNELRGVCMSLLMAAILLLGVAVAPMTVSLLSGALGGSAMIGKALSMVCASASMIAGGVFASGCRRIPHKALS